MSEAFSRYQLVLANEILDARIGIYPHEQNKTQRIRISVILDVVPPSLDFADQIASVYDYQRLIDIVRSEAMDNHINLLETLAARLIEKFLDTPEVIRAKVAIDKLELYAESVTLGIVLERSRATS